MEASLSCKIKSEEAVIKRSLHKIEIEGYPVQYQIVGKGEPILLVHGLSGSSQWWARNVAALSQRYSVYLVDLPGFGTMRGFQRPFVLSEAIAWLLGWMEAVGVGPVHLVGYSMGGYMCLWIAAHHPELVRRLVLVAPSGLHPRRSVVGNVFPLLRAIFHMVPPFWPLLIYDALRAGPITLLQAARDLLTKDVQDDLKSVRVPTLLVWGEQDRLVPPTLAATFLSQMTNARLILLKRAGHVPMFDRPAQFNAALLDFLGEEERKHPLASR